MTRPHLHIYGCGRAARVMARWLADSGQVRIGQVCNRSLESARSAVAFIGQGEAVEQMDQRITGGWLLFGLPDGQIPGMAVGLACRMPGQPSLAFHLSGSMPGAVLEPLGAPAASVHPARAFADPARALSAMPGTWLVAEGEPTVLDQLAPAMQAAGGRWLAIDSSGKRLYHAATVAASNYLVTLTGLARELAVEAGLAPAQAAELLAHLQQGTLDNLAQRSAADALTGPIERGDEAAVASLLEAVDRGNVDRGNLIRALGRATLDLAVQKRGSRDADQALEKMLTNRPD